MGLHYSKHREAVKRDVFNSALAMGINVFVRRIAENLPAFSKPSVALSIWTYRSDAQVRPFGRSLVGVNNRWISGADDDPNHTECDNWNAPAAARGAFRFPHTDERVRGEDSTRSVPCCSVLRPRSGHL